MSGGFKRKRSSTKCSNCLLQQKGLIRQDNRDQRTSLVVKKGEPEILFIFEMPESNRFLNNFIKFLERQDINNYEIRAGLKCNSYQSEISKPYYKAFKNCNCLPDLSSYKVIVPIGRAISAVTQSDDVVSWIEFGEFKFNPTYFYTSFESNKKIRVYPLPGLYDWLFEDKFQKYYAKKQIKFIKQYLNNYEEFNFVEPRYEYVEDPNLFLQEHMDEKIVAWDTETSGLDQFAPNFKVRCIQMCFDGITGYYLPYKKINKRLLSKFFKNKEQWLAFGKFDCKALHLDGVRNMKVDEDVVLLFHLLNTDRMQNSLKTIAWMLGFGGYDKELDKYKEKYKIKTYDKIPDDIMIPYSCLDAVVTYRAIQEGLKRAKKQPDVYKAYKDIIIPVIPYFIKMEINGMKINKRYLNTLNQELVNKLSGLEKQLKEYFGDIDISSSEQLGKAIQAKGWPEYAVGKKGIYSTADFYLKKWKKEGYKIADLILQWRAAEKLRTSFVGEDVEDVKGFVKSSERKKRKKNKIEGLIKFIKSDGYIHSTINPARTDSGRANATGPNNMQFPKQEEEGKKFRPIIGCPEDYYIAEVDYSGFQLRIAAIYSKDPVMKNIFINLGGDMHSVTGQDTFRRDISLDEFLQQKKDKCKLWRYKAKGVNFGFIFGRSAQGFQIDLEENWSDEEIYKYIEQEQLEIKDNHDGEPDPYLTVASELRKRFFKKYPNLMPWIQSCHEFAKTHGYVEAPQGIRRHLPWMSYIGKDADRKVYSNLQNISVNSPVQGFESLTIYKAMIGIEKEMVEKNMKSLPIAMVHDSLVFYVHKDEVKELALLCKRNMEVLDEWDIPILIDFEFGYTWGFSPELDYDNIDESIEEIKKEVKEKKYG
jgi:DNA polymerase-1